MPSEAAKALAARSVGRWMPSRSVFSAAQPENERFAVDIDAVVAVGDAAGEGDGGAGRGLGEKGTWARACSRVRDMGYLAFGVSVRVCSNSVMLNFGINSTQQYANLTK